MAFPKAPEWLKDQFDVLLGRFNADRKFMFGCPVGFVNGNMACGVFGDTIFVRVDAQDTAALLAMEGGAPFSPMKDRPMSAYTVLPPAIIEDDRALRDWLGRAIDHTGTLEPKPLKSKKPAGSLKERLRAGSMAAKKPSAAKKAATSVAKTSVAKKPVAKKSVAKKSMKPVAKKSVAKKSAKPVATKAKRASRK